MLDFEKAFDTVEWSFLFKTLEKFNFGPQFIKWMKLLYESPCAKVKNNGWLSDKITLKRGIHQGCPVSALLFIIIVEILALIIKQSPHKGIVVQIGEQIREMKLSQYADDSCLFLKDETQIALVLKIIKSFGIFAGPKLNLKKTEGIWPAAKNIALINHSSGNIKFPSDPV